MIRRCRRRGRAPVCGAPRQPALLGGRGERQGPVGGHRAQASSAIVARVSEASRSPASLNQESFHPMGGVKQNIQIAEVAVTEAVVHPKARINRFASPSWKVEIDWARYRKIWGDWVGREIDFYRACARLVEPLCGGQVAGVCGPRVRVLACLLRDAYAHLGSEWIPDRLRLGDIRLINVEGNGYRVTAYSAFDPVVVPETLVRVLRYFDGRPTEEVLEAILAEQGVRVNLSLVRRMVDFGILKPCEEESTVLPVVG